MPAPSSRASRFTPRTIWSFSARSCAIPPEKTKVINDLESAMQDPDESVRANAMRALGAIAVLASREPELGIHISATWFVEMLNSIVLSDRFKAATALVNLTEKDGKAALEQIRSRALGSVLEMAQWKNL